MISRERRVVIVDHALWLRAFNADRAALGRTIHVDGEPYTIIDVMPASFDRSGSGDELWVPLALSTEDPQEFGRRYLTVTARLAPGGQRPQGRIAP